jgi:hypothetical protein
MRVIGAGLPRTATLSQKVGLEMLGVGPCYHMVDILSDLDRAEQWCEAIEGNGNWGEIFAGYQATVDWPGAFFYRELLDVYPDAKVLLSVRSGESWARSMTATINGVLYGDTMMHDLSSARCRIDPGWRRYIDLMIGMWEKSGLLPDSGDPDEAYLAEAMTRYIDEVKQTVPADRLLVWTAADGWESLCEFLELPMPESAFPNINDADTFVSRIVESALVSLNEWNQQQATSAPR